MKDFIYDGKKMRDCPHNVAQLNVFEYLRHFPETFFSPVEYLLRMSKEFFPVLFFFLYSIVMLLLYPITIFIMVAGEICRSKKEVKKRRKS